MNCGKPQATSILKKKSGLDVLPHCTPLGVGEYGLDARLSWQKQGEQNAVDQPCKHVPIRFGSCGATFFTSLYGTKYVHGR